MVMARTEVVSTKFGNYRITSNDILGLTPWLKVYIELFITLCRWRMSGLTRVVEKQLCDQLFLTNLKTKQKHDFAKIYCGNWSSWGSGGVVDKKSDLGSIVPWSSIAAVFFP